jgi:wobble nucleotide-excising tRNase
MAITRIACLRHPGVFSDFKWPADVLPFGRYNLIYGWNGSGKTTISRVFRALEMQAVPTNSEVTLSINGQDIQGDTFTQHVLPVRVFNRDFINESVFPVGGGDVPPIFIVGKESIEKQKKVEEAIAKRSEVQKSMESACSKKQKAERDFDQFCIDRARSIKEMLRSSGSNPYNNYDKSSFKDSTQTMMDAGDVETYRQSEADYDSLLAQARATPKPKLQMLSYRLPLLKAMADAATKLMSTTVVSAAIKAFKDDAMLSAWARQGLLLHNSRNAEQCLFCEQPLPQHRLAELETHFSTQYEETLKMLDMEIARLKATSKAANMLVLPNPAELYEDLAAEYKAAKSSLQNTLDSTQAFLESVAQSLSEKKNRLFESLSLDSPVPDVDSEAVDRVNAVIQKHNQACNDFQNRVAEARRRLEACVVANNLEEVVRIKKEKRNSAEAEQQAETEVKRLAGEIELLERQIVEHRQPAEELNEDLRKYLGHNELCLEIKDAGYLLSRNSLPAKTLSEGEITAIALLYFLKSLRDRRFDLTNGVVVLDDPVSSLDATALYLAFGFIRERTQDAAQLFIFTHNFTFFRQVRNWFHHLKGQNRKDLEKRPARYYMLDCAHDGIKRCSCIRPLDPLLEQYESEYHYLFARIYREARALTRVTLESNYILPNMARRLLEAFLAFRQPQVSGELWQKLKNVEFDEAKKLRILRFLHTHSHGDTIGEPQHDPSVLAETQPVLRDLMELIEVLDPIHYEGMKSLATISEVDRDEH